MTSLTLSSCLLQAAAPWSWYNEGDVEDDDDYYDEDDGDDHMPMTWGANSEIVGLFVESTGLFLSLNYLLESASAEERSQIMSFRLPPPTPPRGPSMVESTEHPSITADTFRAIALATLASTLALVLMAMFWTGSDDGEPRELPHYNFIPSDWPERVAGAMTFWFVETYASWVDDPLRRMYRQGPWLLGAWEGLDVPHICARTTLYANLEFWQNGHGRLECERIYEQKLLAWLRLVRPPIHLVLLALAVASLRLLWGAIHYLFLSRPPPPMSQEERDMRDMYRAFQVLMRQANRSWQHHQQNQMHIHQNAQARNQR